MVFLFTNLTICYACYPQVGSKDSGKSSVVQTLATLVGQKLHVLSMNSAMDTTELLGGFEQVRHGVMCGRRRTKIKMS